MFKKFFGKDEEDVYDTIDPVLEQRRKEKFSVPLIYNDDENVEEIKKEVKKEEKKVEVKKKKTTVDDTYHMSEIISPMTGIKQTIKPEKKKSQQKKKIKTTKNDELIPVMSPFYGPSDLEQDELTEEKLIVVKEQEEPSVEQNLRDIADIVKEEQDQLKIIEERTGEFKLDFQNDTNDSLIDEIDDTMSLDELMSLYEKKFKD